MKKKIIIENYDLIKKTKIKRLLNLDKRLQLILHNDRFTPYTQINLSTKDGVTHCVFEMYSLRRSPNGCFLTKKVQDGITYNTNKKGASRLTIWNRKYTQGLDMHLISALFNYLNNPYYSRLYSDLKRNLTKGLLLKLLDGKIKTTEEIIKHKITYSLKIKGITQDYHKEMESWYKNNKGEYNAHILLRASEDPANLLKTFHSYDKDQKRKLITSVNVRVAEDLVKFGDKINWLKRSEEDSSDPFANFKPSNTSIINNTSTKINMIHDFILLWQSNSKDFKSIKLMKNYSVKSDNANLLF